MSVSTVIDLCMTYIDYNFYPYVNGQSNFCLTLDNLFLKRSERWKHIFTHREILSTPRAANIKIQMSETRFLKEFAEFIGHIIIKDGIKSNSKQVEKQKLG